MTRQLRAVIAGGVVGASLMLVSRAGEAHKPITSPFTYNEDVFPILRERCGACHVAGGVAPMSLMTYGDAVPWGESIRAELIAGRMPPWPVDTSRDHFRNAGGLTGRELNVLLTWAAGGTPPGDPAKAAAAVTAPAAWPLGPPDLELGLDPVTIAADTPERTVSFVVAAGTRESRMIRAIDLRPGTASVVRSAIITVKGDGGENGDGTQRERVVSLWQPGERPAVGDAAAFELPAGASLDVVVRYKKTWQYERKEMRDQSRIGIYFAAPDAQPIEAVRLTANAAETRDPAVSPGHGSSVASTTDATPKDVRLVAVYPDASMSHVRVSVDVVRPDGSRENVIALRAQPQWARRYWFARPLMIPKGSRYSLQVKPLDEIDEPSTASPNSAATAHSPAVTLNVIAAR